MLLEEALIEINVDNPLIDSVISVGWDDKMRLGLRILDPTLAPPLL